MKRRISSSSVMVFTFCTDYVIYCMPDLTLCFVFRLRFLLCFAVRSLQGRLLVPGYLNFVSIPHWEQCCLLAAS